MDKVFTFWEGQMPAYIRMCLNTWKRDYILLDYTNLAQYTDISKTQLLVLKCFTLPQIADYIRVHVLRDNGGYWLDTDTIMLSDRLPEEDITGFVETRDNTIGFLHTKAHSDMFEQWAKHQDLVLAHSKSKDWDVMGNRFTDSYIKSHKEIVIHPVDDYWLELAFKGYNQPRKQAYQQLYFGKSYRLSDLHPVDLIMLHNSWTPDWYKQLTEKEVLLNTCTLSNILREVK